MKNKAKIFAILVLLASLFHSGSAQLSAHWRFDSSGQSIQDFSENNNSLYFKANSIRFDGKDDYIQAESLKEEVKNSFTVTQWVKPLPGRRYFISSAHDWIDPDGDGDTDVRGYWLEIRATEGEVNFVIGNGTQTSSLSTISNWKYDKWSHIAASVTENGKMKIFVNGEKVAEQNTGIDYIPRDTSTYISSHHGGSLPLNGSISNAMFYNTSLTDQEIQRIFSGEKITEDLIAHWPMKKENRKILDVVDDNHGKWYSSSTEAVYDFEDINKDLVEDKTSNKNKGTLKGIRTGSITEANWTNGRTGSGLKFDGSNDKVTVNPWGSNSTKDEFTVSAWVKLQKNENSMDSWATIVGNNQVSYAIRYNIFGDQDYFEGFLTLKNQGKQYLSSNLYNGTGWHHVATTFNGTNFSIYVDGELQGSKTVSKDVANTSADGSLVIGDGFGGKIDEVKIFGKSLDEPQISAMYQNGLNRLEKNPELSVNKVLDIPFDHQNSTHVFDLSISGDHGIKNQSPIKLDARRCISSSCYNFSDNYVNLNNLNINTSSGAKTTIAFWMNWRETDGMPFGWGSSYDLWFNAGCFGFNTGSGDVYGINSSELPKDWTHVTAVFYNGQVSNTTNELWINGEKKNIYQCEGTSGSELVTEDARISSWRLGKKYFFPGKIDSLKIFRGELSKEKIQELAGLNTSPLILDERLPDNQNLSKIFDMGFEAGSGNTTYSHSILSEGVKGTALEFKGRSRGLDIQDSSSLTFQDSITVSAWFNLNDWNSELYPNHVSHHLYKSGTFGITTTDTRFRGWITDNGTRRHVNGEPYSYNEWHHVAITYNSSRIKMYQNGELTGETTHIGKIDDSNSVLRIGNAGGFNWGTDGKIDEVKISSRALTKQEIKNLYRTQKAEFGQSSADIPLNNSAGQRGIFLTDSFEFNSKDETAVAENVFWPQESFTFSTWIKNSQKWGKNLGTIWQSQNGRVFLREDSREIWGKGKLVYGWYSNGKTYGITTENKLRPDTWYHVTATYNASNTDYSLYLNGREQKDNPPISGDVRKSSKLKFTSGNQIFSSNNWHGKIDETRIYGKAVGPKEVQRLAFR